MHISDFRTHSVQHLKKLATAALFAALAYVAMFVTSWIKVGHEHVTPFEAEGLKLIIDEMLAIRSDIDAWREKKESQEAQAAYSSWLNREARWQDEE